jgi:hypothetical protein
LKDSELRRRAFAEILGGKNSGLISVTAPSEDIDFDDAVAFWSAFYVKTFKLNARAMKSRVVEQTLKALAVFFKTPIHFATRDRGNWLHQEITTKPEDNALA